MLLVDLPVDIKRLVIEFITRPVDLKVLCLTNKHIRELSTPALYRNVSLRVGGQQDLRLTGMLHPGNPGLKHVHHIDLRLERWAKPTGQRTSDSDDSSGDDGELVEECVSARFAQLTVKMLLDYLPRDVLESFTWHPWEPISVENYCLLLEKQKKLQYLELGPIDRHLNPILERTPQLYEGFTDLKQLDFYPDSVDRLKAAQKLLKTYPKITSLSVMPVFEYNRKESTPGKLKSTLFVEALVVDHSFQTTFSTQVLEWVSYREHCLAMLHLSNSASHTF